MEDLSKNFEDFTQLRLSEKIRRYALYGSLGNIIRKIEPHTEANTMALLVQALAAFGNMVGNNAYFQIGKTKHHTNLMVVIVGKSAKSRKGTSANIVMWIAENIDESWVRNNNKDGLSSGEGLIWHVRDPIMKKDSVEDEGVSDKRLFILEGEFGQVLTNVNRNSNTLSAVIRNAWDGKDLNILSKNSPCRATKPHISMVGHITSAELKARLSKNDLFNGFANRIMWVFVSRGTNLTPDGGNIDFSNIAQEISALKIAYHYAQQSGQMSLSEGAVSLWTDIYKHLSLSCTVKEDESIMTGVIDALTSRAEAQVLRLACIYALIDCTDQIREEHLLAGLAVWDYSVWSVDHIFGELEVDSDIDKILDELKENRNGLNRTQIRDIFNRNKSKKVIDEALNFLLSQNLVRVQKFETNGRPEERWFYKSE